MRLRAGMARVSMAVIRTMRSIDSTESSFVRRLLAMASHAGIAMRFGRFCVENCVHGCRCGKFRGKSS